MITNTMTASVVGASATSMPSSSWLVTAANNHTFWMNLIVRIERVRDFDKIIKACLLAEAIVIVFYLIQLVFYDALLIIVKKSIHINMQMLGYAQLVAFLAGMISRLIMIAYEAEVIPCNTLADFPLPLLNIFRLWNYNMVFQIPLSLTIERYAATKYLRDYERRPRPWIGLLIAASTLTGTLLMSVLSVTDVIDGNLATALSMVPIAFFIYLFRDLLRENEAFMEELQASFDRRRSSDTYSLSLRVQLNENIGIMKASYKPLIILLVSAPLDIAAVSLPALFITEPCDFWLLDVFSVVANLTVAITAATVAPMVAYHFIGYHRNRVLPLRMQHTPVQQHATAAKRRTSHIYRLEPDDIWYFCISCTLFTGLRMRDV